MTNGNQSLKTNLYLPVQVCHLHNFVEIMDRILILFFIGMAVGIFVPIVENRFQSAQLLEEPLTVIQQVFATGTHLWHLSISILVLITLPSAIFKSIRNRISKKALMPIPFMTGLSFGFTFMSVIGIVGTYLKAI